MLKKLSPEQTSKILEKLPEELKEAFFSIETAEKISDICEKFGIPGGKVPFIVNYIGQVLLGILSPEEIEILLEKEADLGKETARNVNQQVYRYIFFPVKEILATLSDAKQALPASKKEERPTFIPPQKSQKPDVYREPTE